MAGASGNTIAINTYDAYGIPGSTNQGTFQYTGQMWIEALGIYYYKARIYSPTLGRFLQTDPIGYEDQVNLYAYVGNDPVNMVDPTGEVTFLAPVVHAGLRCAANAACRTAVVKTAKAGVKIVKKIVRKKQNVRALPKPKATKGAAGGKRAGKSHTRAAVKEAKRRNAARNGGKVKCESCGRVITPTTRRTRGSKVNPREGQGDHVHPRSEGGDGATVKDQENIGNCIL